jgi:hypothetical protein
MKKNDIVVLGIQSRRYRNSFSRGVFMSTKNIMLSQACEGMIHYKQATGKSENTIADYRVTFKKLFLYLKHDQLINSIAKGEMIDFFGYSHNRQLIIRKRWGYVRIAVTPNKRMARSS